jgi:hypothetical protein
VLRGGVAIGVVGALAAGLGLDGPAPGARVLSVEEMAVVAALAAAMFPKGAMPIDGVEAGVPAEVDRLVDELLPAPHRVGFRLVLRAIEWGTLASRGARFSQLDVDERRDVLDTWSDPGLLPRRLANDSVKLLLGMAWFRHPAIQQRIGWRTGCGGGTT